MSGAGSEVITPGEQRKAHLENRDDKVAVFMEQGRSVSAIAKLTGMDEVYTRKAIKRIAAERGIDYRPKKEQPGELLTDDSREYRRRLADMIYDFRLNRHPVEVGTTIGLSQAEQIHATNRGGQHDVLLSQVERLAKARGESFTTTQLRLLLGKEKYEIIAKCLNI